MAVKLQICCVDQYQQEDHRRAAAYQDPGRLGSRSCEWIRPDRLSGHISAFDVPGRGDAVDDLFPGPNLVAAGGSISLNFRFAAHFSV